MVYIAATGQGLRHNDRLDLVLSSSSVEPWKDNIDKLYRAILIAHAPRNPAEFDRFKRRLALLCLPVDAAIFVEDCTYDIVNFGDVPIRAIFEETLDDVWDSITDLASLFGPRQPLSGRRSPLPILSHRSFRDFSFNRARCGDDLYYRREQDLHAEVVSKVVNSFSVETFKVCLSLWREHLLILSCVQGAELNGRVIGCIYGILESHCKEATKEVLGRCMDDIYLEPIPISWPLLVHAYLVGSLLDGLYVMASEPVSDLPIDLPIASDFLQDFPDGIRRREALISKIQAFFRNRVAASEEWDLALLRLAISGAVQWRLTGNVHSVYCWHVARNTHCQCLSTFIHSFYPIRYQTFLRGHAAVRILLSTLVSEGVQSNTTQDALTTLQFILSVGEASELSAFLSLYVVLLPSALGIELSSVTRSTVSSTYSSIVLRIKICTTRSGLCAQSPTKLASERVGRY